MQVPLGTAKTHVHRGLARLRQRMAKDSWGLALSSGLLSPRSMRRPRPSLPPPPTAPGKILMGTTAAACCTCIAFAMASVMRAWAADSPAIPTTAGAAAADPDTTATVQAIVCQDGVTAFSSNDHGMVLRLAMPRHRGGDVLGYRCRMDRASCDGAPLGVSASWFGVSSAYPSLDWFYDANDMAIATGQATWRISLPMASPPMGSRLLACHASIEVDHAVGAPRYLDLAPASAYVGRWYAIGGLQGCLFKLAPDRSTPPSVEINMSDALLRVLGECTSYDLSGAPIRPGCRGTGSSGVNCPRSTAPTSLGCRGWSSLCMIGSAPRRFRSSSTICRSAARTSMPLPTTAQRCLRPCQRARIPLGAAAIDASPAIELATARRAGACHGIATDARAVAPCPSPHNRQVRLDQPSHPLRDYLSIALALPTDPPLVLLACHRPKRTDAITDAGEHLAQVDSPDVEYPVDWSSAAEYHARARSSPESHREITMLLGMPAHAARSLARIDGDIAVTVACAEPKRLRLPLAEHLGTWCRVAGHAGWAIRAGGKLSPWTSNWAASRHPSRPLKVEITEPLARVLRHVRLVDEDGRVSEPTLRCIEGEGRNDVMDTDWVYIVDRIPQHGALIADVYDQVATRTIPFSVTGPLSLENAAPTSGSNRNWDPQRGKLPDAEKVSQLPVQLVDHVDLTAPMAAIKPSPPTTVQHQSTSSGF